MRRSILVVAALTLLVATGCVRGRIYSHTTEPLTRNYDQTPVVEATDQGDVYKIEYNNLSVEWNDNSIGAIAEKAGFDEVYYADVETMSILGIWTTTWVHVYGRRGTEPTR